MKYFNINYIRLIQQLLPVVFRKELIMAFLRVLTSPISRLHNLFMQNRSANIYHLGITGQICYLEKVLNDRFDSSQRRIYISNGNFFDQVYIFTQDEELDIFIDGEGGEDLYLFTEQESGSESVDFIVNVPLDLQYNDAEMKAIIDMYKLASKTYKIDKK